MAGGRWRRSGEGDHKGRPYEAFDSGNAVGPADGQSLPRFLAGSCRRPGGATSSRPLEGRFLAALLLLRKAGQSPARFPRHVRSHETGSRIGS